MNCELHTVTQSIKRFDIGLSKLATMMIKNCSSFYFRWTIGIVQTQHMKDNFEKLLMNHSKSFGRKGSGFFQQRNFAFSSHLMKNVYYAIKPSLEIDSNPETRLNKRIDSKNQLLEKNRYFSTSNVDPLKVYQHKEVEENVFHIEENYFDSWNKANIFFIRGEKSDLLIDAGIGVFDLSKYLQITELRSMKHKVKPLHVVATHTHFDHSGGLYHFDLSVSKDSKIYVHQNESSILLHSNQMLRDYKTASWITEEEIVIKPYPGWNSKDYRVNGLTDVIPLNENSSFDLGNFHFKVIHLPGHTSGSIGLLEEGRGILVTGDTLYSTTGELIDWYVGGSSVIQMVQSVRRLSEILESKKVPISSSKFLMLKIC